MEQKKPTNAGVSLVARYTGRETIPDDDEALHALREYVAIVNGIFERRIREAPQINDSRESGSRDTISKLI